jgi:hypothetical protein
MNKNTSYREVATMAARHEADGDYARAAHLWDTARQLARNATNEAWCQSRAERCELKMADA